MDEAILCRRYLISGRVQGVFYRVSAQQVATSLQLRGWVRNRRDGRVELFACGTLAQHDLLKNWLEIGPPHAKVTNIDITDEATEPLAEQFEIHHNGNS